MSTFTIARSPDLAIWHCNFYESKRIHFIACYDLLFVFKTMNFLFKFSILCFNLFHSLVHVDHVKR